MIEVSREKLIAALEPCAKVAEQRAAQVALSHVLIGCDGARVRYRATNLRHEVSGELEATGSGAFSVNARELLGVVTSLAGETVKLDVTGKKVTAKATGPRKFGLPYLPPEEFPNAMNVGGVESRIPAGLLARAISSVSFASYTGTDHPERSAVRIEAARGTLTAVALNGAVLAKFSAVCDGDCAVSIPLDATRLLLEHDGEALITSGGAAVAFRFGASRVSALLPSGDFPPYEAMLASLKDSRSKVTCSAKEMLDAVKAVRRASDDICLRFSEGKIEIEAVGSTSAIDEIEASGSAHKVDVFVSSANLTAALGVAGDEIEIAFGDELDPLRMCREGWTSLLMPIRPETAKARMAA